MNKKKVLFVCIHNSARSQMAEAFLNQYGGQFFAAGSAGIEPGELNRTVVEVMREAGIDISSNKTKSVMDMYKKGREFDYVIAVCDASAAERCPIFPGDGKRIHWPFEDPSGLTGNDEEKLAGTRKIRDSIKARVMQFIREEKGLVNE